MNTEKLATVYLDNQPISLQDARPKVSAILFASGKPNATDVKVLQSRSDTQGKPLRPEEIVDRTSEPNKPIYLTCTPSVKSATATASGGQASSSTLVKTSQSAGMPGESKDSSVATKTSESDEDASTSPSNSFGDGSASKSDEKSDDDAFDEPATGYDVDADEKEDADSDDEDANSKQPADE